MQATQLLPSIAWFFTSMQAALQLRAQSVQPLHFSLSIVMRNKAKREKNPSTVPTGQNAQAEVIFTNDMFLSMESAALNPVESMGGLMTKAALNTLIGMGTVFVMLIMISLIISLFNFIPKIQAAFSKKDKEEEAKNAGIDKAVTQIAAQEEPEADDTELVAVIAAAIAASEGAASTDGFVVRSIRKVR
jgi:sodium pump decarboxylase gamma subunit